MKACVLSSYEEVSAALRNESYAVGSSADEDEIGPILATMAARIAAAEPMLHRDLPSEFDLINDFVRPWADSIATGGNSALYELRSAARAVFLRAACPDDSRLVEDGLAATKALAEQLGSALAVQAFVALCETLPAFLGNACQSLFANREQLLQLRANQNGLTTAIEELLRYSGPAQVLFRRDTTSNQSIQLRVAEANQDALAFTRPEELNLSRRPNAHLAFGAGKHTCPGAATIRLASSGAMRVFLNRFAFAEVISARAGRGSAIHWLEELLVRVPSE